MAKYDLESFITEFEAKLKPLLAAKILEINAEKNDDLVLDQIPDEAWVFNNLDIIAKNYKDFIFFFIDDISGEINGPSYTEDITLEVDIFIQDRQDKFVEKRILRYSRALREAVAQTWDTVGVGYDKASIKAMAPIDIKLNNSSFYHKIFGVSLIFSIIN